MMEQEPDVQTVRSLVYVMLYLCVNPMERIKQKWNVNTKGKLTFWSLEVGNDDPENELKVEELV